MGTPGGIVAADSATEQRWSDRRDHRARPILILPLAVVVAVAVALVGALGSGSPAQAQAQAQAPELPVQIETGHDLTCGLVDGTVLCWGTPIELWPSAPQFVDESQTRPTAMEGLRGVAELSVGFMHACAVADQAVWCWGQNRWGQLGDGTTEDRSVPVRVGGLGPVSAVSAGFDHTCAIAVDGTMSCWGGNFWGQLGDGTEATNPRPVPVTGLSGVVEVSTGSESTCAIADDGQLWCWGQNRWGQLGDGTTEARSTPGPVDGIDDAVSLSVGDRHVCVVRVGGSLSCWGDNRTGMLGDGTREASAVPVDVLGIDDAVSVSAGFVTTCAVVTGGGARCWGAGFLIGDGEGIDRTVPVDVPGLADVGSVSVGLRQVCAAAATGGYCWGDNRYGALGTGDTTGRSQPALVRFDPITADFSGQVRDTLGNAVPQVTIDLFTEGRRSYLRSVATGDDGGWQMLAVDPGCYVVSFLAPPVTTFDDGSRFLNVDVCLGPDGQVSGIDATLIDRRATDIELRARVRNDKTFDPEPGVVVDLFTADDDGNRVRYLRSATTDPDGEIDFGLAPAGCYAVTFIAPEGTSFDGGSPWSTQGFCNPAGRLAIFLERLEGERSGATVDVAVVDGSGAGVEGVVVDLFTAGSDGSRARYLRSAPTTADGTVDFSIGPGCHVVVAIAPAGRLFDTGSPWSETLFCVERDEVVSVVAALS